MKKLIVLAIIVNSYLFTTAQTWDQGGNIVGFGNQAQRIGTNNFRPLRIETNNIQRAIFTHNASLTSIVGNAGDGLRILDPQGLNGNLDLFTSNNAGGQETHIVFGPSGQISGQANRFEFRSTINQGFYFNNETGTGLYKFANQGTVHGFVGTNDFWRIGQQGLAANIAAGRQLEVSDNAVQFRLQRTNGAGGNINNQFTDFEASFFGLNITPRNGGGNFGRRAVFIHRGGPTRTAVSLNVNGNGRFRYVPQGAAGSLILGLQSSGDPNDIQFRRLEFTNNPNDVLLGDGTWGPASGAITADNGLRIAPVNNNVQWGQTNTGIGTLNGAELIQDTEIPMNEFDVFFHGESTLKNNIHIGEPIGLFPLAPFSRLNVYRETNESLNLGIAVAGTFTAENTYTTGNNNTLVGVWGFANQASGATLQTLSGGRFNADGQGTAGTYGVFAIASNGNRVNGIRANANGINGGSTNANGGVFIANSAFRTIGVSGSASGFNTTGSESIGGNFVASGGETNYGVYSSVTLPLGSVNFAGYFQGDVHVAGQVSSTNGTIIVSDKQFKKDVEDISNSLEIIEKLQPKTYYMDAEKYKNFNFSDEQQYGLIAQEVEEVLPTIVQDLVRPTQYDTSGNVTEEMLEYKGVQYIELVPILIGGIQEQQDIIEEQNELINNQDAQIDNLNERLANLEKCLSGILNQLCEINNSIIENNSQDVQEELRKVFDVTLSNEETIILDQNVPNPFAEQTTINFSIPETIQRAQIHFYNDLGNLIQTVEINERGLGQIRVFGSDLSSGVYTYTLVADGEIVATKKMQKMNY